MDESDALRPLDGWGEMTMEEMLWLVNHSIDSAHFIAMAARDNYKAGKDISKHLEQICGQTQSTLDVLKYYEAQDNG